MPTLAQLQSEQWWGREIVSDELDWLGDELCRFYSLPRTAAGTKGDVLHLSGGHRSQEWILNSAFCRNRSYTVQSGLTALQKRLIAGFDFTPGGVELMILQSRRLLRAMQAGELEDVRELYCNVDGDQVVDGWDNVRNRAATSDRSHLWHWHLTLDRLVANVRAVMEKIFRIVTQGSIEGDDNDMTPEQDAKLNTIFELIINGDRTQGGETYTPPGGESQPINPVFNAFWRIEDFLHDHVGQFGIRPEQLAAVEQAARAGAEAGLISGADALAAALAQHLNVSVEDIKAALAQVLGEVRLSVSAP